MPRWLRVLRATLALVVGGVTFVALMIQGVPGGDPAKEGHRVTFNHVVSSGCPERCKKPQRTKSKVTVFGRPTKLADEPSLIEKATYNDVGVAVLRFFVALLAAFATAVTIERILRGPEGPPEPTQNAELKGPGPKLGGGGVAPPEAQEAWVASEEAEAAEATARTERVRALAAERQAWLKTHSRKIKIKPAPDSEREGTSESSSPPPAAAS